MKENDITDVLDLTFTVNEEVFGQVGETLINIMKMLSQFYICALYIYKKKILFQDTEF